MGSIRERVDASGTVNGYDSYYPFGMQMDGLCSSTGIDVRYKFTGKERDLETNYDYFGARYYDSRIGRWLQVDPLASKYPGWSPYNYVMGNPMRLVDPNGMESAEVKEERERKQKEEDEKKKSIEKEEQARKEAELLLKTSIVLNALGATFELQDGIIKLAGALDAGTAKVIGGMEVVGKAVGLTNLFIDGYIFVNDMTIENAFKLGVSAVTMGKNMNPLIAVGIGIADVTGISKPIYKTVGEIPSSIRNNFNQMYNDMYRQLVPRGF